MESNESLARPAPDHEAGSAFPQASGAMLPGLQARLDAYRQARASTFTPTELEAALRDSRWEIRCAAAEHLDATSPRALVAVALDDEDDSVRQAAVRALGRMGASAPVELFQKTLHDSAWQVREMALLTASASGIALPTASLEEALTCLEDDHAFLLKGDVFSEEMLETFIAYKRKNEADAVRLRPHPYEFALYYDI